MNSFCFNEKGPYLWQALDCSWIYIFNIISSFLNFALVVLCNWKFLHPPHLYNIFVNFDCMLLILPIKFSIFRIKIPIFFPKK